MASRFFERLFSYSEGSIEIRCLPSRTQAFFSTTTDKEGIQEFIKKHLDEDVYFGVGTRNGGGKRENVVDVPACWCDVDFKDTDKEDVDEKLRAIPLKPSFVIDSGGGYHLYWKFKEPCGLEEAPQVENLNRLLAQYFGGDSNACDIARILRVPGTVNQKYPDHRKVRLLQENDYEYLVDDFAEVLPPIHKTPPTTKATDSTTPQRKHIDSIMSCAFMQHCRDNASSLSEPKWYAMVTQLAKTQGGRDCIHALSRGYPKYNTRDTDEKILHAINDTGPITCNRIKNMWDCGCDCMVKSPAALAFKPIKSELKTDFPTNVMTGLASDFCSVYGSYIESPKEFLYFSFLTCLGSLLANRVTIDSELRPQPRLYTLILGESADERKSTAIHKTVNFFKDSVNSFETCLGVGSAEGLQQRIIECGKNGLLLIYDEMKAFVSKCKIEGSILLPCVNTMFELNRYESRTRTTNVNIEDAYISILAASTTPTYENMWSSQFTDIGFNNRIFIVPAVGKRTHSIPRVVPKRERDSLTRELGGRLKFASATSELVVTDKAREIYHDWYISLERSVHSKRIDTYAMRFMPLLAVNEMKRMIDEELIEKVITLANWQLEVRKRYDPIDADSEIAKMENRIRRCLSNSPMVERTLKRGCNVNKYGLWLYETAKTNLIQAKEIQYEKSIKAWRIE